MTSIDERVKLMTSRIKLKGRLHAHTGKNPDSYKYQHFLLACCTRLMMWWDWGERPAPPQPPPGRATTTTVWRRQFGATSTAGWPAAWFPPYTRSTHMEHHFSSTIHRHLGCNWPRALSNSIISHLIFCIYFPFFSGTHGEAYEQQLMITTSLSRRLSSALRFGRTIRPSARSCRTFVGNESVEIKRNASWCFFFLYFLFRGYGMRKERSCWWSSVGGAADNPDPLKEFPTGILRASFSLHLGTSKMLNCLALSRRKKMWRKYTSHAVHFQIWRQFYASIRIWINCTRNTIVPVERFTIQSIAAVDSIVFLLSFRLAVLETRRRKWEKNRFECHNGTVCYLNQ